MPKMTKLLKENEVRSSSSEEKRNKNEDDDQLVKGVLMQMWHTNGTRCPKGTVPIRRSTMNDVLRAKSLFDFGKKQRKINSSLHRRKDAPDVVSGKGHEVTL